jgi:hypothetical protein
MTGKNKTPLVGWHPPADLLAQLQAEEQRRGGGKGVRSDILNQALREHLKRLGYSDDQPEQEIQR